MVPDDRLNHTLDHAQNAVPDVLPHEHSAAVGVDHTPLLVHDVVILQRVFADAEVAHLHLVLRSLQRLGYKPRLNRLLLRPVPRQEAHPLGGEDPHQLVLEGDIEPAAPRVALAAGATAELVVDASALVPLRPEHMEPAPAFDLFVFG